MDEFSNLHRSPQTTKQYHPSTQSSVMQPSYAQMKTSNNVMPNSSQQFQFHNVQETNSRGGQGAQKVGVGVGGHGGPFMGIKSDGLSDGLGLVNKIMHGGSNGGNSNINKNVPSFLENRNFMKSSLILGEEQGFSKNSKSEFTANHQTEVHHIKRTPRMSEQPEMKTSSMDLGIDHHKVPSFLQEKFERKKGPHVSELERPQSEKYGIFKTTIPESLTNSYGSIKRSRFGSESNIEQTDPAEEWVKKSMNKKKEKKLSINDFEKIKDLGSGKYGQVFLTRERVSNFVCALKIVEKKLLKEEEITEQFIRELKIQSFLNHPNIIRMYGFFEDHANIYIILEVGTGGQLFKQLKKHQSMPEQKVANLMRQVCQAVNELHSHKIIHRDIKPENIVLSEGVVKLCDFGWSVYSDQTLRTTFCGTPLYVGPEILRGKEYDEKIDIWSLGVMMYEMLVGENPFNITKEEELIKIVKDAIKIPSYVEISEEGRDFLFSCLQKNPEERQSIREALNHEFFRKFPDKTDKKMAL